MIALMTSHSTVLLLWICSGFTTARLGMVAWLHCLGRSDGWMMAEDTEILENVEGAYTKALPTCVIYPDIS